MNKIILSGNLVNDGEFRTAPNDKEVYSGRIAVNREIKDKEGNYITDYFNLVYWNPSEYIKNNSKKGNRALVSGKIVNRNYDAQDGTKKYITEIWVDHFEINPKQPTQKVEEEPIPQNYKTDYDDTNMPIDDNDLPF